jgi:ribose transport system substrate-binding protein
MRNYLLSFREKLNPKTRSKAIVRTALTVCFASALSTAGLAGTKTLDGVGLTVGDLTNPFFIEIAKGAQAKAQQINSSVKFIAESSNYNVKTQSDQIDKFISSGVNLILLGATDSKEIGPAVSRAKQAGIVVVAVDVGAEGGVDATVTSDNKQAGQEDAKYIADRLKGKGEIAILDGPKVTAVTDRMEGFAEQMKNYPGITVISSKSTDGS